MSTVITSEKTPSVEELVREAFANRSKYLNEDIHTSAFGVMTKYELTSPKIYAAIVKGLYALQKRMDTRIQSSVAVRMGPPETGSFVARSAAASERIEDEAPNWGSINDPQNERFKKTALGP